MLHVFNIDERFLIFHIANSAASVSFLTIAYAIVNRAGLLHFKRFLNILFLLTTLELIGFIQLFKTHDLLIKDMSTTNLMISVIPPLLNVVFLIVLDLYIQKHSSPDTNS